MRLFGIVILSIAALVVLLLVVLPAALTEIVTLIIFRSNISGVMVRPGFLLPVVSNPLSSLLVALLMLLVLSWGIWKLSR